MLYPVECRAYFTVVLHFHIKHGCKFVVLNLYAGCKVKNVNVKFSFCDCDLTIYYGMFRFVLQLIGRESDSRLHVNIYITVGILEYIY